MAKQVFQTTALICRVFFLDVIILVVAAEFMRMKLKSFNGYARFSSPEILRTVFYLIAFLQFFMARFVRLRWLKSDGPLNEGAALEKIRWASLISMSLCELGAVIGFIWFLLTGSRVDFYLLAATSLVSMIFALPRIQDWEDWLRSVGVNAGAI